MGKPKNIFEQRNYETNVTEIFNMKNQTPGGGNKGRGGGGTVALNNPCMVMRAQPKYTQ